MKKYRYYIGIDTGANTGLGIWDKDQKKLIDVETVKIHSAMEIIKKSQGQSIFVRVEDARLRTWFGKAGKEQLQGAGSIKRDATIWEDFLSDLGIDFEMVAPKNNKTKLNAEAFKKITGWKSLTNSHGRDAAMLVFGL